MYVLSSMYTVESHEDRTFSIFYFKKPGAKADQSESKLGI